MGNTEPQGGWKLLFPNRENQYNYANIQGRTKWGSALQCIGIIGGSALRRAMKSSGKYRPNTGERVMNKKVLSSSACLVLLTMTAWGEGLERPSQTGTDPTHAVPIKMSLTQERLKAERVPVAFGEGGQIKMLYDRRQRPQSVYFNNKVHVVFNAGRQIVVPSVFSSCCAHQTVFLPLTTIWHLRIQSVPFLAASATF